MTYRLPQPDPSVWRRPLLLSDVENKYVVGLKYFAADTFYISEMKKVLHQKEKLVVYMVDFKLV